MLRLFPLLLALLATFTQAENSKRFGDYELLYSVVNTTFLEPAVAANYGITRGKKRAMLNLSLLLHLDNGAEPRAMNITGETWDLIHRNALELREIREGKAIYYIAEFAFINEEWRFFEVTFTPEGSQENFHFKFKHQLYID